MKKKLGNIVVAGQWDVERLRVGHLIRDFALVAVAWRGDGLMGRISLLKLMGTVALRLGRGWNDVYPC